MPRVGKFGRRPRSAPDLSGTIAALIREAMAQQDQNMLEAWKSGGEVDGKGVTDEMLLAHFRKRRDAIPESDPEWTEWDQRLDQYGFSIEESKMSLKWDQGKVSEMDMSRFYAKWEKTATKNSEFARTLASQAAKWRASADAKNASGRRAGAADTHYAAQTAYYQKNVAAGEYLTGSLVVIAKQFGAMRNLKENDSLEDLDPNSAAYTKFMDVITDGSTDDPYVQGLIDEVTAEIRKTNPDFTFNAGEINSLVTDSKAGLDYLIGKSANKTERKDWVKRQGEMTGAALRIVEAPFAGRVFAAQEKFETTTSGCHGDVACVRGAMVVLRRDLAKEQGVLMQGGVDNVNLGLTPAIGTTLRMLDDALGGNPITLSSDAYSENSYGLMDAGSGAQFIGLLNSEVAGSKAIAEGGWLSSTLITDEQGLPVLNGLGEPTYNIKIHDARELPPVGATQVTGTGALDDGSKPTFYVMAVDVPVVVTVGGQPTDPRTRSIGGTTIPQDAESGEQITGQTMSPYAELPGVLGPDGEFATLFRTGDGTPGNEFIFMPDRPDIKGMKESVGADGVKILTVEGTATRDPVSGVVTTHYDSTAAATYINGTRLPLASGALKPGSYRSEEGARLAGVINNLYDTNTNKADATAARYVKEAADAAIASQADPSADSAAQWADVVNLDTVVRLRETGLYGASLDTALLRINSLSPEQSAAEASLTSRGFTADKYGQAEVDRRVSLLLQVNKYQPPFSNPLGFISVAGGGIGNGPALTSGAKSATQLRDEIFNPLIGVSQIKVPGMPDLFGVQTTTAWPNTFDAAKGGLRGMQPGATRPTTTTTPTYGPPAVRNNAPTQPLRPGLATTLPGIAKPPPPPSAGALPTAMPGVFGGNPYATPPPVGAGFSPSNPASSAPPPPPPPLPFSPSNPASSALVPPKTSYLGGGR